MPGMKLYADAAGRRARQAVGDLLLLAWVWLWVELGTAVHDATLALATPGEQLEEAGSGLAGRLRDAGASVGDLPLVGDEARVPFEGAGDAADRMAAAGAAQAEAVRTLADWLGWTVGLVPVLVVAAVYLPMRWSFVRRATAGRRFMDSGKDLDLFALRALAHQPLHRLARISDDPAGAWRRQDEHVVRSLAALELRDVGLMPSRLPGDA